jgi:hypothetical protein
MQADLVGVKRELESSEEELNRLLHEKMERRTSLAAKVSVMMTSPQAKWLQHGWLVSQQQLCSHCVLSEMFTGRGMG